MRIVKPLADSTLRNETVFLTTTIIFGVITIGLVIVGVLLP